MFTAFRLVACASAGSDSNEKGKLIGDGEHAVVSGEL